jgi:DNA-binding NarL/FixJ family response regulator
VTAEEEVSEQLRRIVRLLTVLATKGMSQKDQVAVLASAGFQPKEIAELLNTTANTVSVTLHSLRKQKAERTAGRGQKKP